MPVYFFLPTLVQCQETEVVICCKLYEWRCTLSVSTLAAKLMESLHLICLINCQELHWAENQLRKSCVIIASEMSLSMVILRRWQYIYKHTAWNMYLLIKIMLF